MFKNEFFKVLAATVVVAMVFIGCGQKYCDESDFRIEPVDGGKAAKIVKYVGNKQTVNIPPRLQRLPVAAIGENAFVNEGSRWTDPSGMGIINVTIPNGVTTIEDGAFYGNQLTSINIPNSVTTIGRQAFESNQLTNVNIGNRVSEIGYRAFAENQLLSVNIPNSVTAIGGRAFAENELTTINIPSSVTEIGRGAFAGNPLTKFSVASGNNSYSVKNFFLLSKDGTELIEYLGNEKEIAVPNGIITIGAEAFMNNWLTSVTIPEGVTTIENSAFWGNRLTSVTIPSSVVTIKANAFAGNNLTNVTIPNGVVTIGSSAFSDNRLTSVTVSNSVKKLEGGTFRNNPLTIITIGANVEFGTNCDFGCNFEREYNNNGRLGGTYAKQSVIRTRQGFMGTMQNREMAWVKQQ